MGKECAWVLNSKTGISYTIQFFIRNSWRKLKKSRAEGWRSKKINGFGRRHCTLFSLSVPRFHEASVGRWVGIGAGGTDGVVSVGTPFDLQAGQLFLPVSSHLSTQPLWKACLQLKRRRSSSGW